MFYILPCFYPTSYHYVIMCLSLCFSDILSCQTWPCLSYLVLSINSCCGEAIDWRVWSRSQNALHFRDRIFCVHTATFLKFVGKETWKKCPTQKKTTHLISHEDWMFFHQSLVIKRLKWLFMTCHKSCFFKHEKDASNVYTRSRVVTVQNQKKKLVQPSYKSIGKVQKR